MAAFGLRLGDLEQQGKLLRGLGSALPPVPPGARVEVTGLPVVASRGYDPISGGRFAASLAGPVVAGMVLVLLLRRWRDGATAVAAAVMAVGWGILVLWWRASTFHH